MATLDEPAEIYTPAVVIADESAGRLTQYSGHVLVVEDNEINQLLMMDMLSGFGLTLDLAVNGSEAVRKVNRSRKYDLVLMDVVMPGLNGYQATRTLTRDEATKHIPVIVCTSKRQETDKIWGLRQGAQDYLVKPVSGEELLAKIAAL